jgi:hypothetical protein
VDFLAGALAEAIRLLAAGGQPWLAFGVALAGGLLLILLRTAGPGIIKSLVREKPPEWNPETGEGTVKAPVNVPRKEWKDGEP